LRAECPGPPGEVVLRSGLPETAEVEFELLALQFQLRPSQKRFKLQVSPTPEEAHPVFAKFPRWTGKISGYFTANWLGTLTDTRYTRNTRVFAETTVTPPVPKPSDEEYFEWIILLQSVLEARNSYTMVELGAGYGRWLVNAWSALRSIGKADISLTLIGVEAEPTHFAWMRQHFITNMLDPERHRLINAAVAASDGVVHFATGHPAEWYGQAIVPSASARMSQWSNMSVREVPAVSLETVLDGICVVDLVDMDIQGAEADVVRASAYLLAERVKRVFIGTHRAEIDRSLRETFRSLGWRCVYDYPCGRVSYTPYGFINFQDGVQSWVNPRLVSDTIENETASAF
jgi:FkbM family methyltransferase